MRITRVYLKHDYNQGQSLILDERAFSHVIKVLRLKEGAILQCFDGKGHQAEATITQVNKKSAEIHIDSVRNINNESKLQLHLGLAISKGDRMDYAIQKSVELGVTHITPLFSQHSVVSLDKTRLEKKMNHWSGIIISACEQCGRNTLPVLHSAKRLFDWADKIHQSCLVMDPLAADGIDNVHPINNSLAYIIGPEGGLSQDEIEDLGERKNFYRVKFGPRVLRTETAAVAVASALQFRWGDLTD